MCPLSIVKSLKLKTINCVYKNQHVDSDKFRLCFCKDKDSKMSQFNGSDRTKVYWLTSKLWVIYLRWGLFKGVCAFKCIPASFDWGLTLFDGNCYGSGKWSVERINCEWFQCDHPTDSCWECQSCCWQWMTKKHLRQDSYYLQESCCCCWRHN